MSRYSLNPAFYSGSPDQWFVTVSLDGQRQGPAAAFAALYDTPSYFCALATVHVPSHDYEANAQRITQAPAFTTREGTRLFDFDSHEAALTFLRSIYGIDAPQPDPEPIDATTAADTASPVQQPTVSPRSVPAPLARDVVHLAPPIPRTTDRASFYGPATYQHPLTHQRNTQ